MVEHLSIAAIDVGKSIFKGKAALAGQPNTLTALTHGVSMFRADVGYGAV